MIDRSKPRLKKKREIRFGGDGMKKILIMSYLNDSTNKINDIFVFFAFNKLVDAVNSSF